MPGQAGGIVEAVRREHELAQTAFRSAVGHAIRCGELLAQAKAQLPHGAFLPWVDKHFPASRRTAQGYVRLAARAEEAQALAHLGIEGALRQLATPRAPALDAARARELTRTIDSSLPELRTTLRELHERRAHVALGYPSWRAFVEREFPMPVEWDAEFAETMLDLLLEPVRALMELDGEVAR